MKIDITLEEVFNKVWERAKIPYKSMDNGRCVYRNPDGSKNHCFVGVCIPDELYDPIMDNGGSIYNNKEVKSLFDSNLHAPLKELQRIHDFESPNMWPVELRLFAKGHNLSIPE